MIGERCKECKSETWGGNAVQKCGKTGKQCYVRMSTEGHTHCRDVAQVIITVRSMHVTATLSFPLHCRMRRTKPAVHGFIFKIQEAAGRDHRVVHAWMRRACVRCAQSDVSGRHRHAHTHIGKQASSSQAAAMREPRLRYRRWDRGVHTHGGEHYAKISCLLTTEKVSAG